MKAKEVNGKIILYNNVPKTLGNTIGLNYMSDNDLKTKGFYDVVEPSKTRAQKYGIIYFDATNEVFTYPVESVTYSETLAELKAQKIAEIKRLYGVELAKTDWIIIRNQELGNTTDAQVLTDRAALRAACATKETEVNALSTKAAVVIYDYPSF